MEISIQVALTIVSIVITLILARYGVMKSHFDQEKKDAERFTALESNAKRYAENCDDFKSLDGEFKALRETVMEMKVKNDFFWKALENKMGDIFKSPTHLDKDVLWEKYIKNIITLDELITLNTIMVEEYNRKKAMDKAIVISRLETEIHFRALKENNSELRPTLN